VLNEDKKEEQRLEEAVCHNRPDVIYERASYLRLSGISVAQRHSIPLILEMNAPLVEESLLLHSPTIFTCTHQGKMCCGRTPMETLIDGKDIWKKRFIH